MNKTQSNHKFDFTYLITIKIAKNIHLQTDWLIILLC